MIIYVKHVYINFIELQLHNKKI